MMKKAWILLVLVCLSSWAFAQMTIDNFESYADSTALLAAWPENNGITSYTVNSLNTADGANGTAKWLQALDAGYTKGLNSLTLPGPSAADNYKVKFYYQSGFGGYAAWPGLTITVKQNSVVKGSVSLGSTATTGWTAAEITASSFTTDPVVISVGGTYTNDATPPTGGNYSLGLDEFTFEAAAVPLQLAISPDAAVILSGTETITATPSGGSGTYTQVRFDVGNNGSWEATDNSSPFTFSWNTAATQAGQGTADIAVEVTDSLSTTKSEVKTFTIDNRNGGRVTLVSSNFNTWTGGLPNGWVSFQANANAVVAEEATSYSPSAGACVKITFTATDTTNRYIIRYGTSWAGDITDLQASTYAKGGSARLYYCTSTDDVTFTPQIGNSAVTINNPDWTYGVGAAWNMTGLTAADKVSIATHQFSAGDSFWDDVTVKGTPPATAVNDWFLF